MHIGNLKSIMGGVFLMDPQSAQSFFPFAYGLAMGRETSLESFKAETVPPYWLAADGGVLMADDKAKAKPTKKQYVQVIPMQSAIIKYDEECGATGTETISAYLREAYADDSVAGIVISADSPGGDAMAVEKLSKTISERNKPVLCHVHGGCNSAMYWIASHCDEIHSDFKLSMIGSIGVYMTLMDVMGYYEKQGVKVEQVYAKQSEEKNGGYRAWQDGDNSKVMAEASRICDMFIDTVSKNRAIAKDSEVFKGGSFFTDDALSFGLIDGTLTFEETINRCYELSEDYTPVNLENKKEMFGLGQKSAVKSLIEATADERTQEMVDAANAELQGKGLDAVLVDASLGVKTSEEVKNLQDKAAKVDSLLSEVAQLKESVSAKDQEISDLQAEEGGAIGKMAGLKSLFGEDADKEDFDLNAAVAGVIAENVAYGKKLNPGAGAAGREGGDPNLEEDVQFLTEEESEILAEVKSI